MVLRVCFQNLVSYITKNELFNVHFTKMPFYAVAKGRTAGIFMTWPDCEAQVKGFSGARYKKFDTIVEAQDFINTVGNNTGPVRPSAKSSSTSSNPLKRSLHTSSSISSHKEKERKDKYDDKIPKKKSKRKSKTYSDSEGDASDDSDDLNTIICKQMDDIEKRLIGFGKGVDKIIKKNTTKQGRKSILIDPIQQVEFVKDNYGYVQVYTDGACSSNGTAGAKAGYGVYWGENNPYNTSAPVSGRATNNCGEIQAASCAIRTALQNNIKKLSINTDSKFLINAVTKWMPGWKAKGWKLKAGEPVKNEIDFKELDLLQNQIEIKWNYVEAHRGVHGNEMADKLAKAGAAMYSK